MSLCAGYPEADVYPADQFRIEWGPIFHRGRLDGSARVLVIGQDPAQHETVVRQMPKLTTCPLSTADEKDQVFGLSELDGPGSGRRLASASVGRDRM